MKKLKNSKGFTLMEMLIVVAIIAILVAIAIPTFTNQLEKAREATDMANLRSAYAEVMASALSGESGVNGVDYNSTSGVWSKTVKATQKVAGWQTKFTDSDDTNKPTIGGVSGVEAKTSTGEWTVSYNEKTNVTSIDNATNGTTTNSGTGSGD